MNTWVTEKVLRGDQSGRSIGYPTINLSPKKLEEKLKEGVYTCFVRYKNIEYKGILFYGPRLVKNETHNVLEIFVLDFDKQIYGQKIEFKVLSFIREVKQFSSLAEL